jgi:transposase
MAVVYTPCCGLDIPKKAVVAWVMRRHPGQKPVKETRTLRPMTADLLALAAWLSAGDCTQVAMESTGVYWRPIYNLLAGLCALLLVHAQHIKTVPGRQTDGKDAAWSAELLRHGLCRGRFVPSRPQRQLRALTRDRTTLGQERARPINRLQNVLEEANSKLAAVVTDIRGVSARAMLEAWIAGERDGTVLSARARGRMRAKRRALAEALQGYGTAHHSFLLTEPLRHIDSLDEAIERVRARIEQPLVDEQEAVALLDPIPGVAPRTAAIRMAEIGTDMRRFPRAQHLASGAGRCPGHNASGGNA